MSSGDFPSGLVLKAVFPMQGMWVPSLFGEPRSHMPSGAAKNKKSLQVIYFAINIWQKEKKTTMECYTAVKE